MLYKLHYSLRQVFPDLGGPMIASLIGTTGLGEGWSRNVRGSVRNWSLASAEDRK